MERWSISEFSTFRWPFEKEIAAFHENDFHSIGIWNQKLFDYDFDEFEDVLFQSQLRVSSYSWLGGFTGSEGISHENAIENAKNEIRLASRIGAQTIIVHPGARNGHTRNHARRLLCLALTELVPVAMDYGVRLAIEPMLPSLHKNWSVFETPLEAIEFVQEFDSQYLGLVLDLFHIGTETPILDHLDEIRSKIALVQVADRQLNEKVDESKSPFRTRGCFEPNRNLIGDGDVPVIEWIARLEQIGYRGFYELEMFGPALDHLEYNQRLANFRQSVRQIESDVCKSIAELHRQASHVGGDAS